MDKTHQQPKSRKGFALLVTLSVLSVVIALSVVLLSYFKEVRQDSDSTKALIQANVYYADIVEQFKKFSKAGSLFSQLYKFPVDLHTPDGRFKMQLACKPVSTGININWLALEKDQKKQYLYVEAQSIFDILVQQYDLKDPDRLIEMILLEIGLGQKFVLPEQGRLIQKKGIISHQQFYSILSRYEMEVDDQRVSLIPWTKYFSFSLKSEKIDIEYSSAELISFLFDIDIKTVREWQGMYPKPSLQSFVMENAGNYNEKKKLFSGGAFLGESHCRVNFGAGYQFTFDYIQGEAKYFEFYEKN